MGWLRCMHGGWSLDSGPVMVSVSMAGDLVGGIEIVDHVSQGIRGVVVAILHRVEVPRAVGVVLVSGQALDEAGAGVGHEEARARAGAAGAGRGGIDASPDPQDAG